MKKRIFAFVAVLVLSFSVLFVSLPNEVHADETSTPDSPLVYSFTYPYYYTTSSRLVIFPYTIDVYIYESSIQVRTYVYTIGDSPYPVLASTSIFTYNGFPSAIPSTRTTFVPLFLSAQAVTSRISVYTGTTVPFYISTEIENMGSFVNFTDSFTNIQTSFNSYPDFLSIFLYYSEISFIHFTIGRDDTDSSFSSYVVTLLSGYQSVNYSAKSTGFNKGFDYGYTLGSDAGYQQGIVDGDASGYNRGFAAARELYQEVGDLSFFGLISSVVDVPVKAFTNLFNFEILGINLFDFMTGLLTLALVITIFRIIFR